MGLCLFELSAVAMSDPTEKGAFHGDVDAVRKANTEDPRRKISTRAPAVTPASV